VAYEQRTGHVQDVSARVAQTNAHPAQGQRFANPSPGTRGEHHRTSFGRMSPPGPRQDALHQGAVHNQEFSQSAASQKRGYQAFQEIDALSPIVSDLSQHRSSKRTPHQQVSLATQAQMRSQSLKDHASAPTGNASKLPGRLPVMQDGTIVWRSRR
jgi:hypothetical protein